MKYCKKCIQADTRPGIFINKDGVCSACVGHEEKTKKIDWRERRRELIALLAESKSRNRGYYDCLIPVSGGKDSTYQVYMMKKIFKMNPLAVTYKYADRTELGQRNLDNLRKIGVDSIEIVPQPRVEKEFIMRALVKFGDPCLPDHAGIFLSTLRVAVSYKIGLIIWGENPQLEYGGTKDERESPYLNRKWLSKHGCLQGTSVRDWIGKGLKMKDFLVYTLPSDKEFAAAKIKSVFLGYYLPWDPVKNYHIAKKAGFQNSPDGPKMGIYDFADLDSTNIIVHHYIKWFKFGITRLHDNISVEIRNGRMSREEGIRIVKTRQERVPLYEIKKLCDYLGITEKRFWAIIERFRNKEIWKKDSSGKWYIPNYMGID